MDMKHNNKCICPNCGSPKQIISGKVIIFDKGNAALVDVYCIDCEQHNIAKYQFDKIVPKEDINE